MKKVANVSSKFGGSLLVGRRKSERPLHFRKPIHIVMRSRWAVYSRSMLNPAYKNLIRVKVETLTEKCGIKIHDFANVGNHLHILAQFPSRQSYVAFIRALSGWIARLILKAERGGAYFTGTGRIKQFWDHRPFTDIVDWGRHFKTVHRYIVGNFLQAIGFDKLTAKTLSYFKPTITNSA